MKRKNNPAPNQPETPTPGPGRRQKPSARARGASASGIDTLRAWFASRSWTPWDFQARAWAAFLEGRSGLINVPTGAGKTYAAFGGPLAVVIDELRSSGARSLDGVRLVYVTPLRAVSRDIELALKRPIVDLGLPITVESRTGDTSSSVRARQRRRLPNVLITTPESLSLLLTWEESATLLAPLQGVILDEWHELIASKRGTQCELALARLRTLAARGGAFQGPRKPALRVWALSATLSNLDVGAQAAVGVGVEPVVIRGRIDRPVAIHSLAPERLDRFPWAGHLGLAMLPRVLADLDPARSTLIFTNTRSQAELWHNAILAARPEWASFTGLHHGSIDRTARERIEAGLKDGSVRLVVATSSLDLGVDFAPVERVYQIGSPKGLARLLQRAGRSSHRPNTACAITCVPTHGFELVEIAAARKALAQGSIEPRAPLTKPLDVLSQHMVTRALGGGFAPDALFDEVRGAYAYRDLTRQEFDWTLTLVRDGGACLKAYPEYHKIEPDHAAGLLRVPDKRIARLHRLNVGTITGDATIELRLVSGKRLGSIEDSFIARLSHGDRFLFAGRTLEFVTLRDLTALARPARGRTTLTPHWSGTRLPISESLGESVRLTLERVGRGEIDEPELVAARPILDAIASLSVIPAADEVLIEACRTREGTHLFLYPFDGRLVHGGLAAVLSLRLTRLRKTTFAISVNDYGLEILTADDYPFQELLSPALFTTEGLLEDALESLNISDLARLQFRDIARVAGLVFQTYPGSPKSGRQLQASAGLIYDVFKDFDPGNLLLEQARREVMERQFEQSRLARTLRRLALAKPVLRAVERPTPLGFPLIVERTGAQITAETLGERLEKMRALWEKGVEPSAPLKDPRVARPGRDARPGRGGPGRPTSRRVFWGNWLS